MFGNPRATDVPRQSTGFYTQRCGDRATRRLKREDLSPQVSEQN